jgi:putative membrane protein
MKKASEIFNDEQTKRINDAIIEAESHTSAEIVPVLATASGRYDRAEDMLGLWFGLILATVAYLLVPNPVDDPNSWGQTSGIAKLSILLGCIVAGFIVGAVVASRVGWLRRLCTPRQQMSDEVQLRARAVFFDNRVHRTAGGSGLLVYMSLYEHYAALIADEAVTEKLGQAALDELCAELTASLRAGDMSEAICKTLISAGQRLGEVLPRQDDDVNELPDMLVTLD